MGRTLAQYRWLPHELSAPLLFINIPAFKLEKHIVERRGFATLFPGVENHPKPRGGRNRFGLQRIDHVTSTNEP